jgi:TetR/AcrR family transcriptional regulator, transcriptional repressor for nem operon
MTSKTDRTRQFIVEQTAPIFNVKGFAGTSLSDMIEVTQLTKGSIYGNFLNKDEVAVAAFEHNFQKVSNYIRGKMDERESIIDKLLVYPETYRNFSKLPFLSNGCPIANTSTEADDTHPQLKEKANEALTYWRNSVERLLKAGIKNDEINPKTNILEFTSILTALIQGAMLHAKSSGKMNYLHASMNYLESMVRDLKK